MISNEFFTNIYFAYKEYGYLNLLFHNSTNNTAILFNGFNFYYKSNIAHPPKEFKELDYSLKLKKGFIIEGIKQWEEITFIKLENGDIFQLYFMADDNKSDQKLAIFIESENSSYHNILKNYQEAEDYVIDEIFPE